MDNSGLLYRGSANIYLEGRNALWIINTRLQDHMEYSLGSPVSNIQITDYRLEPVSVARRAMLGEDIDIFPDIFNQKAWVEVRNGSDEIKITLHDSLEGGNHPTIWLGVIDDNRMPVHDVEWEILKPISLDEVAFVVLLSQQEGVRLI